jgi:hypothetical protein
MYCVFQCTTLDLLDFLELSTSESRLEKTLVNRMINIQPNEKELLKIFLLDKDVTNTLHQYYHEKAYLPWMLKRRAIKRISKLGQATHCQWFSMNCVPSHHLTNQFVVPSRNCHSTYELLPLPSLFLS